LLDAKNKVATSAKLLVAEAKLFTADSPDHQSDTALSSQQQQRMQKEIGKT
jgi:hypothetical protein